MPILFSSTEPDFDLFKRSCGLDFIRLFSPTAKVLPLSPARTKIKPLRAYGHDGMILTVQEPKFKDVEIIAKELPTATGSHLASEHRQLFDGELVKISECSVTTDCFQEAKLN